MCILLGAAMTLLIACHFLMPTMVPSILLPWAFIARNRSIDCPESNH